MGSLGGQQAQQPANPMLNVVLSMLQGQGQQSAGGIGGLLQLVQLFQQKGMGDVMQSWIGTGQNAPISMDQIIDVLGHDRVGQMAQQAGVSHEDAAGSLAQMLPNIIDKLTPQGQLPAEHDLSSQLGGLLGMLKR
jgi:uncharacterized protein YidB (DUF937 family)